MYLPVRIASWTEKWKELTQQDYDQLRIRVPKLPEQKPAYTPDVVWCDLDALEELHERKLEFEIDRTALMSETGSMICRLQERLAQGSDGARRRFPSPENAVQIHVPDLGLLMIREVQVVTDACTDRLQELLNEGWRILAVCPAVSQRRPDYVLGRTKES